MHYLKNSNQRIRETNLHEKGELTNFQGYIMLDMIIITEIQQMNNRCLHVSIKQALIPLYFDRDMAKWCLTNLDFNTIFS